MVGSVSSDSVSDSILSVAQAQEETYRFLAPIGGFGEEVDVTSEDSFANYIQTGITIMIGFAVMAAIVLIIAAGFQYMTSTSQGATTQAKQTMSNAILGLVLALMAVVILQTINPNLVELNAVDTVTTSGSSFDFELEEQYQGVIRDVDANTHGNQYCILLDASWYSFSSDKYVCYNSNEDCQEGLEQAHNDGWSGASCDFYHESMGTLSTFEDGNWVTLEDDIPGISTGGESAAVEQCREEVEKIAVDTDPITNQRDYPECVSDNPIPNQFDTSACSITCTGDMDEI